MPLTSADESQPHQLLLHALPMLRSRVYTDRASSPSQHAPDGQVSPSDFHPGRYDSSLKRHCYSFGCAVTPVAAVKQSPLLTTTMACTCCSTDRKKPEPSQLWPVIIYMLSYSHSTFLWVQFSDLPMAPSSFVTITLHPVLRLCAKHQKHELALNRQPTPSTRHGRKQIVCKKYGWYTHSRQMVARCAVQQLSGCGITRITCRRCVCTSE